MTKHSDVPEVTRLSIEQAEEQRAGEGRMKEKIEQIMSEFDFEKVAKAMASVNWTWWDTAPQNPIRRPLTFHGEGLARGMRPRRRTDPLNLNGRILCAKRERRTVARFLHGLREHGKRLNEFPIKAV